MNLTAEWMHSATSITLLNGIEYCLNMLGEMRVILWRRKAAQVCALLGKNPEKEIVIFSICVDTPSGARLRLFSLTYLPKLQNTPM